MVTIPLPLIYVFLCCLGRHRLLIQTKLWGHLLIEVVGSGIGSFTFFTLVPDFLFGSQDAITANSNTKLMMINLFIVLIFVKIDF